MPQPSPSEIRGELDKILGSSVFSGSGRPARFLRFIVEQTLAGEQASLKEYAVGVSVFERPESYDPREDAIVRLEARRLRQRLREYYATEGRSDRVVIDVPKGGYVPTFHARVETPPSTPQRKILIPIGSLLLLAAGAFLAWTIYFGHAPLEYVAVLPFKNLGGDAQDDYLVEGLADELSAELSGLQGMRVIARSSSLRLRDAQESVKEAGKKLGAGLLIRGSVQRSGKTLRVTVQLVSTGDAASLWGRTFERPASEWFALEDEICRSVASALTSRLRGVRAAGRTASYAGDPQARELYWRARYYRRQGATEALRKAAELFEAAIRIDPRYAPPYAGLANTYAAMGFHEMAPRDEIIPKARAAAKEAIRFDETLSEGHRTLAWINFFHDLDWASAEGGFRRAIELNPSSAGARNTYALGLMSRGRFEQALDQARQAVRLDPLSFLVSNDLGVILYASRRYEEAAAHARKVLELAPDFHPAHFLLGTVESARGRHAEAVHAYQRAIAGLGRSFGVLGRLGYSQACLGRRDEALRTLAELGEESNFALRAFIHSGLGDKQRALDCLEEAWRRRETDAAFLAVEPLHDSLRGEPRFQALCRKLGATR